MQQPEIDIARDAVQGVANGSEVEQSGEEVSGIEPVQRSEKVPLRRSVLGVRADEIVGDFA